MCESNTDLVDLRGLRGFVRGKSAIHALKNTPDKIRENLRKSVFSLYIFASYVCRDLASIKATQKKVARKVKPEK